MMKYLPKVSLWAALCFASGVHAAATVAALDVTSPVANDIPYRTALFLQKTGKPERAEVILATAKKSSSQINAYRATLSAMINVDLQHYNEAEKQLLELSEQSLFNNYASEVIYPLAQVYFAQLQCGKTLSTLSRSVTYSAEVNAHVMFMRVSCGLESAKDSAIVGQSENIINEALMTKVDEGTLWYAYAYFNVASVAAKQFRFYTDADRLFNEALKYVDGSVEGQALKERILLNLGYVSYADNRFDYAADYFSQMPVNGVWADASLLAYGWAAMNAYKPDLAIEAWRQLINLPYKSMRVYEGYMAIPSAYEKAGSFSDALEAYDMAIAEFTKMIVAIDAQLKVLSASKVHEYANHYIKATDKAALPAVIARLYTEDHLRTLVVEMNHLETVKQELLESKSVLSAGGVTDINGKITAVNQQIDKRLGVLQSQLLELTVAALKDQKKTLLQYTLEARITNARLQEEFFQRGGRRLWR